MSIIFIIALIIVGVKLKEANQKLKELGYDNDTSTPAYDRAMQASQQFSPDALEREAESLRRGSESALRARAEALVERYEKSELVKDLVNVIGDCNRYGMVWDMEFGVSEITVTTLTDVTDNRQSLLKEQYSYADMGYQEPARESEHRLALALALQKRMGGDYGIGYQFQYAPERGDYVMSGLTIRYRKKLESGAGTELKSPI